jgi:hypothetical protein
MSLNVLLKEELNYWVSVAQNSNNRLTKRVAENNIQKRMKQLHTVKVLKHKNEKQKQL